MYVFLLLMKQQHLLFFIRCFWSCRTGSTLIFRVFSTILETEGKVRLKAELRGLQAFRDKRSTPRTAKPIRKLESWQPWPAVGMCSCLQSQKTVTPWCRTWLEKHSISIHLIIKLFIYFRGVAFENLVRDGSTTHSERTELRNRLCQYKKHQAEQLICQVSLALPVHIPDFTSISFFWVAVWKSCTEQRGSAWRSTQPAAHGSAMSPPSDPTCAPKSRCYVQEEATKQRHIEVEVLILSRPCALVAELGLCLCLLSPGAQGVWRWPWCKHPLFAAGLGAVWSPAIAHSLPCTFLQCWSEMF